MNQPDLLTVPETPIPPLEAARRRLALARDARDQIEADGCDDTGLAAKLADSEVRMAETDVLRLEKEAVGK